MAITSPLDEGSTELLPSLPREIALHFRDELRSARASALRNAEAFEEVIFVFERFGIYLTKKVSGLGDYGDKIAEIAMRSTEAANSELDLQRRQPNFHRLYTIVKDARNDATHVGAYARHLTASSIELAVVLEDALMSNLYLVQDFMVKNPICAFIWQPLGLVRQTMLTNSFSYLPVQEKANGSWSWLSDFELARLLRSASTSNQRKELLALTLEEALRTRKLGSDPAATCSPDETIGDAIAKSGGKPILVTCNKANDLIGIITPFDML